MSNDSFLLDVVRPFVINQQFSFRVFKNELSFWVFKFVSPVSNQVFYHEIDFISSFSSRQTIHGASQFSFDLYNRLLVYINHFQIPLIPSIQIPLGSTCDHGTVYRKQQSASISLLILNYRRGVLSSARQSPISECTTFAVICWLITAAYDRGTVCCHRYIRCLAVL